MQPVSYQPTFIKVRKASVKQSLFHTAKEGLTESAGKWRQNGLQSVAIAASAFSSYMFAATRLLTTHCSHHVVMLQLNQTVYTQLDINSLDFPFTGSSNQIQSFFSGSLNSGKNSSCLPRVPHPGSHSCFLAAPGAPSPA